MAEIEQDLTGMTFIYHGLNLWRVSGYVDAWMCEKEHFFTPRVATSWVEQFVPNRADFQFQYEAYSIKNEVSRYLNLRLID